MQKLITKLEINARRRNVVNVYLDGKNELRIDKSLAWSLSVGETLTREDIEELKEKHTEEKLYQQAIGLVSRRPRSEAEIRQRFKRKNISAELQNKVILRLRKGEFLDDLAFARAWIENRREFRPRSAWALKMELRQKGVQDETIEEALEGFDNEAAVYKAAAIGARKYRHLDKQLFRKRLNAYLARRGFQYHLIAPAVEYELVEHAGGEDESEVKK